MTEAMVRQAFREQGDFCARLGSAFTARLCYGLSDRLDRETGLGRQVLDWPGDPAPAADNLPLRLCGALHALARSGREPALGSLYPPAEVNEEAFAKTIPAVLDRHGDWLGRWLEKPPQTNEVGRAAVLMSGLLVVAARFGKPLHLLELGASAGLNLQLERFCHDLGGLLAGDPESPVRLKPHWQGPAPPRAEVRIASRAGVDISPLDVANDGDRLLAYVWPDQLERLERTRMALALARDRPVPVDEADAADWLEPKLAAVPPAGSVRVILHSIAFQYFPSETQDRVSRSIAGAGAGASEEDAVAWLRYELLPGDRTASLWLRTWPGRDRLLARAHPHGTGVEWLWSGAKNDGRGEAISGPARGH